MTSSYSPTTPASTAMEKIYQDVLIQTGGSKSEYQKDFKRLQKNFGEGFDKNEILFIFEYCEYDVVLTEHILKSNKPHQIRLTIKESLRDHKNGHRMMNGFIKMLGTEPGAP